MNGQLCMGQPMRIRAATSTKRNAEMRGERELAEIESLVASQGGTVGYQFGVGRDDMYSGDKMGTGAVIDQNDPENTTIFVGNIESDVTEVEIRREFNKFGSIPFVKIPP
ncbi:MAG: hypothetical protein EZS28_049692, partial [Streblomastix strix]